MREPAIELRDVSFTYPGGHQALCGVSLTLGAGEWVTLMGANGSGKSTLLKLLIGLLRPTTGHVKVMGRDAGALSVGELARYIGFAFQSPERQLFSATVREEIAFGPRNLGLSGYELEKRVSDVLAGFGLEALAEYPPAVLSFGLRRLVALASIAALGAPILALDEPFVGLDGRWQGRILGWLERHRASGGSVLLATHRMDLAVRADRVVVLKGGRLIMEGTPGDVFRRAETLVSADLDVPPSVELSRRFGIEPPALTIEELAETLRNCPQMGDEYTYDT